MSVIRRILFLSLISFAVAVEYYCENDVTEDSFCLLSSVEVSSYSPICKMQFPNQSLIQFQFANLEYLSPRLLYRMISVERLDIFNSYVGKAYVKPELEYLKISGSKLNELQIDPREEHRLTELHLPANELTRLPSNLKHLKNLTMLDLSNNRIDYVDMSMLDDLVNLLIIQLNDNLIKVVFASGTVQLKALTYVSFSTNDISLMDISRWETPLLEQFYLSNNKLERLNGFPEKFSELHTVSLTDNPWFCDWRKRTEKVLKERQCTFEWFDCGVSDENAGMVSIKGLKQEQVLKESLRGAIQGVAKNATGGVNVGYDDIVDDLFCRIYGEV